MHDTASPYPATHNIHRQGRSFDPSRGHLKYYINYTPIYLFCQAQNGERSEPFRGKMALWSKNPRSLNLSTPLRVKRLKYRLRQAHRKPRLPLQLPPPTNQTPPPPPRLRRAGASYSQKAAPRYRRKSKRSWIKLLSC